MITPLLEEPQVFQILLEQTTPFSEDLLVLEILPEGVIHSLVDRQVWRTLQEVVIHFLGGTLDLLIQKGMITPLSAHLLDYVITLRPRAN